MGLLLLLLLTTLLTTCTAATKNVLFIVVDDMRTNIGAYNFSLAHTPNLDKLASTSLTFKRAFVQYAFCAPSRNSFMSGRRPDTTRVWNFQDHFREKGVGDQWKSLPEYFKANGYITMGSGKLYHPTVPPDNDWPKSWTTSPNHTYYSPECMPPRCPHSVPPRGHVQAPNQPNGIFHCTASDPPDDPNLPSKLRATSCPTNTTADETRFAYQLEDQRIRDSCTNQLKQLADEIKGNGNGDNNDNNNNNNDGNFFLGCGFHKPHVPWQYPEEFLQHFPTNLNDIPLADDTFAPTEMPDVAWHWPGDVHGMNISFNGTSNATRARNFRRSYYAAISYTDYNIGRVLDTLDVLNLTNSTLVAVIGDHGWQLGEHDTWAKMTNFEVALRVPLIVRAPWKRASRGAVTTVLAEAVDLYPTFVDLAGLPSPWLHGEDLNGTSLAPVFEAPFDDHFKLKEAAYSQFAKPFLSRPFLYWPTPRRNETEIMGYSVRTDQWRYTCWFGFDGIKIVPRTDHILGRELYDHRNDRNDDIDWPGEHVNVVHDSTHAVLVAALHAKILKYIQLWPVPGVAEA